MASVCFYFQVHQPFRLRKYTIFDDGEDYFDDENNAQVCRKVAQKCYLPANDLIMRSIEKHQGRFRVSYSITGVLLEQLAMYAPEVLSSFQRLAQTGCVEFLAETYYHTLAFLYSRDEFAEQVRMHQKAIHELFGAETTVFRNTELIYNNDLAHFVRAMGFKAILCEGADHLLGYRSPNFLYRPAGTADITLLLKNYRLSDDIAFRFSDRQWSSWPLTAPKFAHWISQVNGNGNVVNLFMDYETIGEHQWEDTGIFDFLECLPDEVLSHPDNGFMTVSEVVEAYEPVGIIDTPNMISWADTERDLSAWQGNAMQTNALWELYRMEQEVKETHDARLIADWRRLQTSDHFYYMCTKWFADGDVHKYFNPYDSPYESYINMVNVMDNLRARCRHKRQLASDDHAQAERRHEVAKAMQPA